MSLFIDRELARFDGSDTTTSVCRAIFAALGDPTALPPFDSLEQLSALDPQQYGRPSPETMLRARSVEVHTALRVLSALDDREVETPTARRRSAALAMDGEPSSQQTRAADAGYRLMGISYAMGLLDHHPQEGAPPWLARSTGQALLRVLAVSEFGLPFLRLGAPAEPFVATLVEPHAGANSAALMELAGGDAPRLAQDLAARLIPELERVIRRDAQQVNAVADAARAAFQEKAAAGAPPTLPRLYRFLGSRYVAQALLTPVARHPAAEDPAADPEGTEEPASTAPPGRLTDPFDDRVWSGDATRDDVAPPLDDPFGDDIWGTG